MTGEAGSYTPFRQIGPGSTHSREALYAREKFLGRCAATSAPVQVVRASCTPILWVDRRLSGNLACPEGVEFPAIIRISRRSFPHQHGNYQQKYQRVRIPVIPGAQVRPEPGSGLARSKTPEPGSSLPASDQLQAKSPTKHSSLARVAGTTRGAKTTLTAGALTRRQARPASQRPANPSCSYPA